MGPRRSTRGWGESQVQLLEVPTQSAVEEISPPPTPPPPTAPGTVKTANLPHRWAMASGAHMYAVRSEWSLLCTVFNSDFYENSETFETRELRRTPE